MLLLRLFSPLLQRAAGSQVMLIAGFIAMLIAGLVTMLIAGLIVMLMIAFAVMLAVAIMLVVSNFVDDYCDDERQLLWVCYEHDYEVCYGYDCYDDHMQLMCNMSVQKKQR